MKLICSACEAEIAGIDTNLSTAILGVGYLEAALNLQQIIQQQKITEIIFIGTAGSYHNNLQIGDIVSVTKSSLLLGLNKAYAPIDYESFMASNTDVQFVSVMCLSSLEITSDEASSKQIYQHYQEQYLVENMELYGVAKVANMNNIPWSAYLGITNYTNANAHQDWLEHNVRVSEKFSSIVH